MAESKDLRAEDAQTAAKLAPDASVEHIADVYAQAFIGAADAAAKSKDLLAEFDSFVFDVLDRLPKLEAILNSALVSEEERSSLLDKALGKQATPAFLNFLKVVSKHGRSDCLRAIHRQTHAIDDERNRRVPVRLTTAVSVGPESVAKIVAELKTSLGGDPIVEVETDPALIGGAVLRIGDTVYDGSIANQLKQLRQQMTARSAHEIQSRRDRFRYTAGN